MKYIDLKMKLLSIIFLNQINLIFCIEFIYELKNEKIKTNKLITLIKNKWIDEVYTIDETK